MDQKSKKSQTPGNPKPQERKRQIKNGKTEKQRERETGPPPGSGPVSLRGSRVGGTGRRPLNSAPQMVALPSNHLRAPTCCGLAHTPCRSPRGPQEDPRLFKGIAWDSLCIYCSLSLAFSWFCVFSAFSLSLTRFFKKLQNVGNLIKPLLPNDCKR